MVLALGALREGYVKPKLESKSPGSKRRPPSLLTSGQQTAHYDDEAMPQRRHYDDEAVAWPPRSEEIPVHRTFIDFGSLTRTPPDSPLLTVSTAPATMSRSVKEALDAWKTATAADDSQCDAKCSCLVGPPSSTASSTRVSEFTLFHDGEQGATELPESVTSTKDSGFWESTPCSTPRSLSESSQPGDPSALLYADLCRDSVSELRRKTQEALKNAAMSGRLQRLLQNRATGIEELPLTAQMSGTGVEAPYQGHAPPLLPFNAYYRGNFSSCRLFEEGGFSSAFPANAQARRVANARAQPKPSPSSAAAESTEAAKTVAQKQAATESREVTNQVRTGNTIAQASAEVAKQAIDNDAEDDESCDDGSSSDEDLGLCVMYSENVPLPSIGSSGHSEGTCKRCCFFPKGRCNNGFDCQFCHFAHEKRKSKMKKKKKRRKKRPSTAQSGAANVAAGNNSQSPQQAHSGSPSAVQQVFGSNSCWNHTLQHQSPQRPSQLIVQGLSYVPATVPAAVMPGNPATMPMVQTVHWW